LVKFFGPFVTFPRDSIGVNDTLPQIDVGGILKKKSFSFNVLCDTFYTHTHTHTRGYM